MFTELRDLVIHILTTVFNEHLAHSYDSPPHIDRFVMAARIGLRERTGADISSSIIKEAFRIDAGGRMIIDPDQIVQHLVVLQHILILDEDHRPVHPISTEQLLSWVKKEEMSRVDQTFIPDGLETIRVSTVFLTTGGLVGAAFETMVFGGTKDGLQERYNTWNAAKAGHKRIVAEVEAIRVQMMEQVFALLFERMGQLRRFALLLEYNEKQIEDGLFESL